MVNIPLDYSKNIYMQIKEWQDNFIVEQMANDVELHKAIDKSMEKITEFMGAKWKSQKFRDQYANDITEAARKDPELFARLWEAAQVKGKKIMDEVMDDYSQGKISKKEMEEQLKFHSIIFKEIGEE